MGALYLTPSETVFRSMIASSDVMGMAVTNGERAKARDLDRRVVAEVMVRWPHVSKNGFWTPDCFQTVQQFHASQDTMLERDFLGEFNRAVAFLTLCCGRRKTIRRKASSYSLKHSAEGFMRELNVAQSYISNGALILAAIALGFRVERIKGTPNCFFNLSVVREARR